MDSALLDLLLGNRGIEGLVGDVKVVGCLRHSDHKLKEFSLLGKVRRGLAELPPVLTDTLIPEGINNYGNCIGFVSV